VVRCSAAQLKDAGINWVILGHSERRQLYKESDKVCRRVLSLPLP
jgi:triosephosphate isomerase